MWHYLNYEEMEKESGTYVLAPALTRKEIEDIIIFAHLKLYNSVQKCGAEAICLWMNDRAVNPIPSIYFISTVLKKNCLIYQRTGQY